MNSPTLGQLLMFVAVAVIGWFCYLGFTYGSEFLIKNVLIVVASFVVVMGILRR